jgi:hypothetical protein
MPYIETPDELADAIADMAGIYGGCNEEENRRENGVIDCTKCTCRIGFVADMSARIWRSVANGKLLNPAPEGEGQIPPRNVDSE